MGGSALTIWMEHLCDELDSGSFIGVLLREIHRELEGSILPGGVLRSASASLRGGHRGCQV